jgi:flagellar biosynthesis activator protein FlaF
VYSNPLEAYKTVDKTTMSGRETEARVLTLAAIKLKDCQDNWSAKDRDEKLDEALKYTQRIWSIFQWELSRKENPLPKELKINLLRLSSFVDKQIFETMSYPSPEKLTAVININQNIAAGLRDSPSDG